MGFVFCMKRDRNTPGFRARYSAFACGVRCLRDLHTMREISANYNVVNENFLKRSGLSV